MNALKVTTDQLRERLEDLESEIADKEAQMSRMKKQCDELTAQNATFSSEVDQIHRQTVLPYFFLEYVTAVILSNLFFENP